MAKNNQIGYEAVPLTGGTMTGLLVLSADPAVDLGAATRQYVDSIASGITFKSPCLCSTTAPETVLYNNGAGGVGATLTNNGAQVVFSADGQFPIVTQRVLVQFQASTFENGIYEVTDVGSGATNWVLTRTIDFDDPAEITPGSLVIVQTGNLYAVTSWLQTDTVVTVGADPIQFSQFTSGVGANTALSNLVATAINQAMRPNADGTLDIGTNLLRWRDLYPTTLKTGHVNNDSIILQAYDTLGSAYTPFITLKANNTPSCELASGVIGTTQAPGNNSTKISTTAYADAAGSAAASGKANKALDNLAAVNINATLITDTDVTYDLGSITKRWKDLYATGIKTDHTNTDSVAISGYNTGALNYTDFITVTANATATCALNTAVTAVTQAGLDNSTKIATTAYVDAATGGGSGANVALSNLVAVAVNTHLNPGGDITSDLGSPTFRWRNLYTNGINTGTTNTNTTILSAYNTGTLAQIPFITLTANATPTCTLAGTITGVTQASSDNSTKLATTAYADAQVVAVAANKALSNLTGVAINTTLVSDTDNTDDLGTFGVRWKDVYALAYKTGQTNTNPMTFSGYNTVGATYTDFITITTNATATCALSTGVTGVTQASSNNSTLLATTAYADAQVVAIAANKALSNLSTVAVNLGLIPGVDNSIDLGSTTLRWKDVYPAGIKTDVTAGHTTILSAYNTVGLTYTPFITLTANATPTCALASGVTAATQAALDNSTKIATTAYVDSAVTAGGANVALSNLVGVAINTTLLSDTDNTDDLGTVTKRWRDIYPLGIKTGTTNAQNLTFNGYNTTGGTYTPFITITTNATATCAIASAVTAVTQAASDNSTKLATTAYVDAAVSGATGLVWVDLASASVTMVANRAYIINNGAGLVTLTLPAVAAVGAIFGIVGKSAGLWKVAQVAGQSIVFNANTSTVGVGGSLAAVLLSDCVWIVCTTANSGFTVYSSLGNITVT